MTNRLKVWYHRRHWNDAMKHLSLVLWKLLNSVNRVCYLSVLYYPWICLQIWLANRMMYLLLFAVLNAPVYETLHVDSGTKPLKDTIGKTNNLRKFIKSVKTIFDIMETMIVRNKLKWEPVVVYCVENRNRKKKNESCNQ